MKYVLLSADNNTAVYSVPDEVANNLRKYCIDFCDKWLRSSSYAKKYRIGNAVCYNGLSMGRQNNGTNNDNYIDIAYWI